jgi:hypothetical protein
MPTVKQSMPTNPPSAAPPTKPAAARVRDAVERLAATLDPLFPSVVVDGEAPGIDEPSYQGRTKPDFVQADDDAWGVT